MVKNFLITGPPGSGKTTLLKELIKELKIRARGFYTEEIRENTRRVGFKIITLENKEGILAHYKFKSSILVSKYRVNLRDLEEIGVKE
ncbi:AAA family ATPase, partial [Candidatus Parcubacteria bacterium]|nr:AAA family ATPase [Candidatus Parcubacteria bacterium]